MGGELSKLSVQAIRARFVETKGPVPPHLLHRLKRDPRQGVRRIYEILRKRHDRERKERLRVDAMLHFERVLWRSGIRHVAGVDEVGVGPLAGPVVAAAVVFPPDIEISGIDDSKRLDPERREVLAARIRQAATGVGIGLAEVEEIDRLNVYRAGLLAMRRAVEALPTAPEHVLVDARTIPELEVPQNPFQRGDGINFSIAAASIVAKTHRDRLMEELDSKHPGYGFARHKGYGTAEHQQAIQRRGPCPIHRMSFPVIRELRGEYSTLFYTLRRSLEAADSREALAGFEQQLTDRRPDLAESEQRKLSVLLARRWRSL